MPLGHGLPSRLHSTDPLQHVHPFKPLPGPLRSRPALRLSLEEGQQDQREQPRARSSYTKTLQIPNKSLKYMPIRNPNDSYMFAVIGCNQIFSTFRSCINTCAHKNNHNAPNNAETSFLNQRSIFNIFHTHAHHDDHHPATRPSKD